MEPVDDSWDEVLDESPHPRLPSGFLLEVVAALYHLGTPVPVINCPAGLAAHILVVPVTERLELGGAKDCKTRLLVAVYRNGAGCWNSQEAHYSGKQQRREQHAKGPE